MNWSLALPSSPLSSSHKHGDRFIPSRAGANWNLHFHRLYEPEKSPMQKQKIEGATSDSDEVNPVYSALLKNELLEAGIENVQDPTREGRRLQPWTAYLWNASTCQVTNLCDLSMEGDCVTSVGWSEQGNLVAIGTDKGFVQIWDVAAEKILCTVEGHTARVGVLAWNANQISSGSQDRMILQRDLRAPPVQCERWLQGHTQEVCRLKWSTDYQILASGGNDNTVIVWSLYNLRPVHRYIKHVAAVKAMSWSPHQHGLLASGGGISDGCIHFWNTVTGQPLQHIDTGSQVCNLAWSRYDNELVSTHGYAENQIAIWKYPSLTQVAKLTGHLYRVLYLAMSPDGQAIVTGAGDETLRFWNVFHKTHLAEESVSVLRLFANIR
uniref:CDC20/Fizzy WD40 domain-containing protein n=1 Tax=Vombatus ursinus TaxID=29139 RepID=A0A4X2LJG8_VOMUR